MGSTGGHCELGWGHWGLQEAGGQRSAAGEVVVVARRDGCAWSRQQVALRGRVGPGRGAAGPLPPRGDSTRGNPPKNIATIEEKTGKREERRRNPGRCCPAQRPPCVLSGR